MVASVEWFDCDKRYLRMSKIEIASWLNKGYAEQLVKAAQSYWDNSKTWVMWAINQKDESQSEQPILGLLAWERLTERLDNEDGELFRKRVQHALVNTVEAGEISSISDIFERLGIEVLRVTERIDGRDWDIISIDFTSHTMSEHSEILPELIQLYGRACRRYEFTVHNVADVGLSLGGCDVQWDSCHVEHNLTLTQQKQADIGCMASFIGVQTEVHQTSLLPLSFNVVHKTELEPFYGFLSKESSISIATLSEEL